MTRNYRVEDVPRRAELRAQAQALSVEDFFARRMSNRVRKAPVGNWMILYEDTDFVYLGYPRFRGLFDDQRETEELLRTPRKALEASFPGWKQIDGEVMQETLRQTLKQAPAQWQARLEKECLRVTGTLTVGEHAGKSFELRFDKQNLRRILAD